MVWGLLFAIEAAAIRKMDTAGYAAPALVKVATDASWLLPASLPLGSTCCRQEGY